MSISAFTRDQQWRQAGKDLGVHAYSNDTPTEEPREEPVSSNFWGMLTTEHPRTLLRHPRGQASMLARCPRPDHDTQVEKASGAQARIEDEVKALMLPMEGKPNKPIDTLITLVKRITIRPYINEPWGASLAVQKILPLIRSKIKSFEKNTLQGTPSEIARLLTAYNEMLLALGSSEPPVKDRPVDLLAAYNRLKGFPEDGPKRFTLIRLALGLEIVHKTTAAEAKTENNRFLKDELLLFVRQLKKDNVIPGTVYAIEFCELITDIYDRANQGAEGIEHLRALDKVYGFKKPNRAVFDELIKCLQPEEAA